MIATLHHGYRIVELCEAFGVSRSGYYGHLRKHEGRQRREDEALRAVLESRALARLLIHDYIDAFYNTRRIRSSLGHQSPLDFKRTQTLSSQLSFANPRPRFPDKIR